jgi:spore coat protein U-like protein
VTGHLRHRSGTRRVRKCMALAALATFFCPAAHALFLGSCTVTASAVAFGTYTPLTTAPSTGTITVSCGGVLLGGTAAVTVGLSAGASGSFAVRQMRSGTNTLSYNLYTTVANNVVWGDGSGGSSVVNLSVTVPPLFGTGQASATVYGLVPSQDPAPGAAYTDNITVTVSY